MVSVSEILSELNNANEMSDELTLDKERNEVLECDVYTLEGNRVTVTVNNFDDVEATLETEWKPNEDVDITESEILDVSDVSEIDVFQDPDGDVRMVIGEHDYGF